MDKMSKIAGQVPDGQAVKSASKGKRKGMAKKRKGMAKRKGVAKMSKMGMSSTGMGMSTGMGKGSGGPGGAPWCLIKKGTACSCTQKVQKGDIILNTYRNQSDCQANVKNCGKGSGSGMGKRSGMKKM